MLRNIEIKKRIKEIIDKENKKNPLKDEKIASILNKEGYKIARRTVSKYREKLRIPTSKMRRTI